MIVLYSTWPMMGHNAVRMLCLVSASAGLSTRGCWRKLARGSEASKRGPRARAGQSRRPLPTLQNQAPQTSDTKAIRTWCAPICHLFPLSRVSLRVVYGGRDRLRPCAATRPLEPFYPVYTVLTSLTIHSQTHFCLSGNEMTEEFWSADVPVNPLCFGRTPPNDVAMVLKRRSVKH